MVWPLVAVGLGGLALSATANLYAQKTQRDLYRKQAYHYWRLHDGYEKYLATQGRSINPNRAWSSYYGQFAKSIANYKSSHYGSYGTVGGSIGAGAGIGQGLFKSGSTSKWL